MRRLSRCRKRRRSRCGLYSPRQSRHGHRVNLPRAPSSLQLALRCRLCFTFSRFGLTGTCVGDDATSAAAAADAAATAAVRRGGVENRRQASPSYLRHSQRHMRALPHAYLSEKRNKFRSCSRVAQDMQPEAKPKVWSIPPLLSRPHRPVTASATLQRHAQLHQSCFPKPKPKPAPPRVLRETSVPNRRCSARQSGTAAPSASFL